MNRSDTGPVSNSSTASFAEDVWAYLELRRGMRQTDLNILAPASAIYIVIFMFGLTGNLSLLWLILSNRSFHTPTNYYLVNLSVSDLLVLMLGLPHDLYTMWSRYPYLFGETGCRVRALLSEASMISSVLTITALTVERYIAICHPLSTFTFGLQRRRQAVRLLAYSSVGQMSVRNVPSASPMPTKARTRCPPRLGCSGGCLCGRFQKVQLTLCVIWILSIACSLPLTLQMSLSYLYGNDSTTAFVPVRIEESSICTATDEGAKYPILASSLLFFLMPLVLISILYTLIMRRIYRSVQFTRSMQDSESTSNCPPGASAFSRMTLTTPNSTQFQAGRQEKALGLRSISQQHQQQANEGSGCGAKNQPRRGKLRWSTADRQLRQLSKIQQLQNEARIRTNKALIKMLICIVVAFFACFAPFHAERLLVLLTPESAWIGNDTLWMAHELLYHISGICLFANSVFNPILYNIMSRRIRSAFKEEFLSCFNRQSRLSRKADLGSETSKQIVF
ncbi:neuromedin U receptor activity [Sparganum proliferum]